MLFKFFRSNRLYIVFVIPILGVILWLKQFMYPSFTSFPFDDFFMPFYKLLSIYVPLNQTNIYILAFSLLLIIVEGFMLNTFNAKYNLVAKRSYLPSLIFILLASSILPLQRLTPVLFGNLFLLFALKRLFEAHGRDIALSNFFDAAFCISLASLFYVGMVFFGFWIIIALIVMRPFIWREWVVSVLGFILPYLLLSAFYFLFDLNLESNITEIVQGIINSKTSIILGYQYLLLWAFTTLILLVASYDILKEYQYRRISTRNFFTLFFFLFVISITIFFIFDFISYEIILVAAMPVAYIFSHYLLVIRKKMFAEFIFGVLIFLIALIQFMDFNI